jgi:hypothetical protein
MTICEFKLEVQQNIVCRFAPIRVRRKKLLLTTGV